MNNIDVVHVRAYTRRRRGSREYVRKHVRSYPRKR